MNQTLALLRTSRQLGRLYDRQLGPVAAAHSMTRMELDVLLFLANNPECDTARDIVELRCIAKSYVSKAIDALYRRGLLTARTDARDRRAVHLSLQPAAAGAVRAGRAAQEVFFRTVMRGVSEADAQRLTAVLTQMLQNVQEAI